MRLRFFLLGCVLAIVLAACDVVAGQAPAGITPPSLGALPTLYPTIPPPARPASSPLATLTTAATPTRERDSGWNRGDAGLELRHLLVDESPDFPEVPVTVVRLDPHRFRLRVSYSPENPQLLRIWFANERPLLAINGGFFQKDYSATALVVSDGTVRGTSYENFGGMFAVGPAGDISIRALDEQPYTSDEQFMQVIQSFPMLVFPNGAATALDNEHRARRSAIAMDRSGRLLLIVCPVSSFTLHGFAQWLANADLEIERALNLDGGSSTGLFVNDGEAHEALDSFGPLPIVLMVEKL